MEEMSFELHLSDIASGQGEARTWKLSILGSQNHRRKGAHLAKCSEWAASTARSRRAWWAIARHSDFILRTSDSDYFYFPPLEQ